MEPRVRRVVAEHLGVGVEELAPNVSLTDDLAVDSLDLVELALALEADLGISVPESVLDEVRTYGDLVATAQALTRRQREAAETRSREPALIWARILPPVGRPGGDIQRAGRLTPYAAETIAEDALRAGRGTRLELTVPAEMSDATLARVQDEFGWLGERGVLVSVRRDQHLGALAPHLHPDAAA